MKIAIFTADSNGRFPVPAVKGGAVSTLIELLAKENNEKQLVDMTVVSLYNAKAEQVAKEKYPNIDFYWVKVPRVIRAMDNIVFWIVKTFLKKKKSISYKSIFSLLYYISRSSKFIEKKSFDKIILENNIPIARIIKSSGYNGDYYYHFHNVPRINGNCQEVFDDCTGFLCVSQFVGRKICSASSAIGKVPSNKVHVLYNSLDTSRFQQLSNIKELRVTIAKKYNFNPKSKVILFTGRLSEEKGIDKVLDSLSYLDNDDWVFLVVGSIMHGSKGKDAYLDSILNKAHGFGNKVKFTGYVDQKNLPKLYNVSDVAVLPSMWDEPAGLTMIEALACGTPVITTNSGGISEYVGDAAIVLNRYDKLIEKMATAIDKVLANPEEYRGRGIERIGRNFSSKTYLERLIKEIGV